MNLSEGTEAIVRRFKKATPWTCNSLLRADAVPARRVVSAPCRAGFENLNGRIAARTD
jgi:hypothetical protein